MRSLRETAVPNGVNASFSSFQFRHPALGVYLTKTAPTENLRADPQPGQRIWGGLSVTWTHEQAGFFFFRMLRGAGRCFPGSTSSPGVIFAMQGNKNRWYLGGKLAALRLLSETGLGRTGFGHRCRLWGLSGMAWAF